MGQTIQFRERGRAIYAVTVMLLLLTTELAVAHSFTTVIVAPADDGSAALEATISGFRLATRERDGHPNEKSDGHLGGLDVYIVSRRVDDPQAAVDICAAGGLAPDFVLVAGSDSLFEMAAEEACETAIVFRPGRLPPDELWLDPTAASGNANFAARFQAEYGRPPNHTAAEGYNAARRLDRALRSIGTLSDRAALIRALSQTKLGLTW